MPKAEGKEFDFLDESHIRTDFLETFEFDSPEQFIKTETDELSAVCPFSGLPDYGTLIIEYYPAGGQCVELKSLKYYMTSFRNVGIFQEALTRRMYLDLKDALKTNRLQVTTIYMPRGGFNTTCVEGCL